MDESEERYDTLAFYCYSALQNDEQEQRTGALIRTYKWWYESFHGRKIDASTHERGISLINTTLALSNTKTDYVDYS